MKKFKIKNRQKRKYTRHNAPQSSYQFSPIFAGLIPMIILAIALAATLLMNMNLREQTVSFQPQFQLALPKISLAEIMKPLQNLPNLLTQPAAFFAGLGTVVIGGLESIVLGLNTGFVWLITLLDPRAGIAALGQGMQTFFVGVGYMGILLFEGFARIGELLLQSTATVGEHMVAGANTIWSATVEYGLLTVDILSTVFWFLFNSIIQLVLFLFNGLVSIVTFIADGVIAVVDALVRVILIPFQILGAFWMQIKPYADTLLHYCGLALEDTAQGFNNLANIGSLLED
jgi:hypothetical protein